MNDPHQPDSPLVKLMVSMSGASGGSHESEPPGADAVALKAGHEADKFGAKAIVLVPVFVAITLALTYVIVTITFNAINVRPAADQPDSELVKLNDAPINDRFARTSSTEPKNPPGHTGAVVPQPRLEYLRQTEGTGPANYQTRFALPTGNSPEIHPEDLRAERYIDPKERRRVLTEAGWRDREKKTVAHISIDLAMKEVLKTLPVQEKPVSLTGTGDNKSKQSNAGRGGPSQPVAIMVPEVKKDH